MTNLPVDPLLGALVGNYRVLDLLGVGGMGRVYRARHPEIDRLVAIKVLGVGVVASEEVERRFRVEARAVNRIRHPNIVDVQDFGRLPDGRPYYVMEYLEGESLHAYLKRAAPMPVNDALVLLAPVVDALEAAHNAGIVHRDLKPENIFLVTRTGGVTPKLLDFGIAKVMSEVAGEQASATQSGAIMGTPLYMSPEQAAGRASDVGVTSDVYSLGVIAYQMLAGATPFAAGSLGELLLAHMQLDPAPLERVRPELPAALARLVMTMLAKSPGARPATAAAVRARIAEVVRQIAFDAALPLTVAPAPPKPPPAETVLPPASTGKLQASTSPSNMMGELGMRTAAPPSGRRGLLLGLGGAIAGAGVVAVVLLGRGKSGGGGERPVVTPPPLVEQPATPLAIADAAPAPIAVKPASIDAAPAESELEERLEALKRLHDDGLINDAEYERRRQAILKEL